MLTLLFAERPEPGARAAAAMLAHEIEMYDRFGDEYGYVFLVCDAGTVPA